MPVAVVTGASSGIGAELCRRLRAKGTLVVGLARRPVPDADEYEHCDVADRDQVETAAAAVLARHARIDLLVLNAGIGTRSGFLDGDLDEAERVMRTNYFGSVWALRAFLPGLAAGARVVVVVSVAGMIADGPYSASKHAQLAFARSVSMELGRRGIQVLIVNPGYVETPGFPHVARFGPIVGRIVVQPSFVAGRILDGLEHGRREIVVPRWYRPAGWVQALAPGAFARLRSRL